MSNFGRKDKKGILRRLSVFTSIGSNSLDREISWPFARRTPTNSSFNQWRYELPVDIKHPMTISRRPDRRVTLGSIWQRYSSSTYDEDESRTCRLGDDGHKGKELLQRSVSNYEHSLLPSVKHATNSNSNSNEETHVNAIFQNSGTHPHDCFLSAFGTKGSMVGEYQDAKDVTCLSNGDLLITDLINNRVQTCSSSGTTATIFSPSNIKMPWATAVTQDNTVVVTLCKERCVKVYNVKGEMTGQFGQQYFVYPTGIATDNRDNRIVCDSVTDKVVMFDKEGNFMRFLGNSFIPEQCFNTPRYVCVSITGEIIVSDGGHHKIKVFDSDGNFLRSFGSFGKGEQQFKCPYGVSANKYGDIYVSDHYNSRISMFSRDGVFIRHVVTSDNGLVHPQGLTINQDLHMFITHGYLKANEILIYKLSDALDYEFANVISYV